jgi:hypothetical protein
VSMPTGSTARCSPDQFVFVDADGPTLHYVPSTSRVLYSETADQTAHVSSGVFAIDVASGIIYARDDGDNEYDVGPGAHVKTRVLERVLFERRVEERKQRLAARLAEAASGGDALTTATASPIDDSEPQPSPTIEALKIFYIRRDGSGQQLLRRRQFDAISTFAKQNPRTTLATHNDSQDKSLKHVVLVSPEPIGLLKGDVVDLPPQWRYGFIVRPGGEDSVSYVRRFQWFEHVDEDAMDAIRSSLERYKLWKVQAKIDADALLPVDERSQADKDLAREVLDSFDVALAAHPDFTIPAEEMVLPSSNGVVAAAPDTDRRIGTIRKNNRTVRVQSSSEVVRPSYFSSEGKAHAGPSIAKSKRPPQRTDAEVAAEASDERAADDEGMGGDYREYEKDMHAVPLDSSRSLNQGIPKPPQKPRTQLEAADPQLMATRSPGLKYRPALYDVRNNPRSKAIGAPSIHRDEVRPSSNSRNIELELSVKRQAKTASTVRRRMIEAQGVGFHCDLMLTSRCSGSRNGRVPAPVFLPS